MTAPTPSRLLRRRTPKPTERIPEPVRLAVHARSKGVCELDGPPCRAAHLHHRRLRSQLGEDTPENLTAVCGNAHNTIHLHPEWAYETGWLVRSTVDPSSAPVRLFTGRLVLLRGGRYVPVTGPGGDAA